MKRYKLKWWQDGEILAGLFACALLVAVTVMMLYSCHTGGMECRL